MSDDNVSMSVRRGLQKQRRPFFLWGAVIVCVCFFALGYYFFIYLPSTRGEARTREDVEAVVREVGERIILPQNEVPTVLTVSDPAQLRDQDFFLNAEIGDRVILFPEAGKAILYDPVSRKIREVYPLFVPGVSPDAVSE